MHYGRWKVAAFSAVLVGCSTESHSQPPPQIPDQRFVPAPPAVAMFENPGGMWLPKQLGTTQADTLRRLQLQINPASLADPMAAPLGAVVSLGGCSASFVSPRGLVITNHHCVTGALQYNSTPERNLLEDGYWAKTPDAELSIGPTGRVFVTQAFTDVTERVRSGLETIEDPKARHDAIEKREKEIVAECEKRAKNVRCEVANFYGGGEFQLVERLEIKDVRLVYAPPRGIGNFGGEVDNWRWPRHTGDFSFYRAYVGKDGNPAEYSPNNVPYQPRHHLRMATERLAPNDLVLVAGYPGRTYRLHTADETEEAVDWYYPYRIRLCEEYLKVLDEVKKGDPSVAIKATPLERGLSNVLTYTRGALEGLTRGGALEQRRARDRAIEAWVAATPEREKLFGDVLPRMREVFVEKRKHRDAEAYLGEMLRIPSLVSATYSIVRLAEERPKPDAERKPEYQQRNWENLEQSQQALEKRYARALDVALLSHGAIRSKRLPPKERATFLKPLTGEADPADEKISASVARLFKKTRLEDTALRVRLLKTATLPTLRALHDPLLDFVLALRPLQAAAEDRDDGISGRLALLRPKYVEALRAQSKAAVAPDANGTLRVTYGTVRGYRPRPDAPVYEPFTVLSGVVAKNTNQPPFDAPQALLEAAREKRFGRWLSPRLGHVPVDFLADLDITGGNSGSPTLNARGELTGLAFDGNYEAMASDWLFMPSITRSIHVDIRYVLWVLEMVTGADALLNELGVGVEAASTH